MLAFYLASILTSYLASILNFHLMTFFLTFYLASILTCFLPSFLAFYLMICFSGILFGIYSEILFCHLECFSLACVEARQCPLRSGAPGRSPAVPTDSVARGWSPTVPTELQPTAIWSSRLRSTEIWSSRLRSGSAHWDRSWGRRMRKEEGGRGRRKDATLRKSRDPHLAGGE